MVTAEERKQARALLQIAMSCLDLALSADSDESLIAKVGSAMALIDSASARSMRVASSGLNRSWEGGYQHGLAMVSVVCDDVFPHPKGMTTGPHKLSLHTHECREVEHDGYERQPVVLVPVEGAIVTNEQEVVFSGVPSSEGLSHIGVWNEDEELILMVPVDGLRCDGSSDLVVAPTRLRIPV